MMLLGAASTTVSHLHEDVVIIIIIDMEWNKGSLQVVDFGEDCE